MSLCMCVSVYESLYMRAHLCDDVPCGTARCDQMTSGEKDRHRDCWVEVSTWKDARGV